MRVSTIRSRHAVSCLHDVAAGTAVRGRRAKGICEILDLPRHVDH